jgi:hypothetical protein
MVQPRINSKNSMQISCPECRSALTQNLTDVLLKGNDVYCEMCGFRFVGIQQGEVKPLPNSEKPIDSGNQPKQLTKQEKQWIKWKSEWNKMKSNWKTKWDDYKNQQTTQQNGQIIQPGSYNTTKPQTHTQSYSQPAQTSRIPVANTTHETPYPPRNQPEQTSILKDISKLLNKITPLFYFIITLATFINFVRLAESGNLYLMTLLGLFPLEIMVISIDRHKFRPEERRTKDLSQISHAGIPQIIVGLFGLRAFGIGIIMLTRGVLILIEFLQAKSKQKHPAVISNPCRTTLWVREIITSYIPYFFQIVTAYFIASMFESIGQFANIAENSPNPEADPRFAVNFGFMMYTIITGFITWIIISTYVNPNLKRNNIEDIPTGPKFMLIILGFITAANGLGTPLLLLGVLFFFYNEKHLHLFNIPPYKDIRNVKFNVVPTGNSFSQTINYDFTQKTRQFDPETGQLVNNQSQNSFPTQYQAPIHETNHPTIDYQNDTYIQPQEQQKIPINNENEISEQIFAILDSDVRSKLIKLNIEKTERDEIARNLIYLGKSEQLSYLDEIYQVNLNPEEIYQKFIQRIHLLSISNEQKQFLIEQLDYLPEDKQEEFIQFLEQTVTTPNVK